VIVVGDSSPVMNLAAIGRLVLLERLYGHVFIPGAVFHEIAVLGAGKPSSSEVSSYGWIETVAVVDRALITRLIALLDSGEAEAIACAVERSADLLLIDVSPNGVAKKVRAVARQPAERAALELAISSHV
jgi:predicted nucleic acid-binding protein